MIISSARLMSGGRVRPAAIFETTALALDGAQKGTYYGSVKWGWETDGSGTLKKVDLALISAGMPSANFLAAATQWNSASARGTVVTAAADTQVYDGSLKAIVKLAKDTKVKVDGSAATNGVSYNSITVDGGPSDGVSGYIKTAELKDQGDGTANTKLPVADVQLLSDAQELSKDVPGPWRETRTLAKGTRVVKTGAHPGLPSSTQVWVKAVDGPDIGAEGYVDATKLTPERP
jgi:hypothetical protein